MDTGIRVKLGNSSLKGQPKTTEVPSKTVTKSSFSDLFIRSAAEDKYKSLFRLVAAFNRAGGHLTLAGSDKTEKVFEPKQDFLMYNTSSRRVIFGSEPRGCQVAERSRRSRIFASFVARQKKAPPAGD